MENKDITTIINPDIVKFCEKKFGKKYSDWTYSEKLEYLKQQAISSKFNQRILKNTGDTYFGICWDEFIKLCESQEFEIAYRKDFLDNERDKNNIEEEIVLIHKEKGLVLYANSHISKTKVNCAKLYGEVRKKKEVNETDAIKALIGYSHNGMKNITQQISLDAREQMIARLRQLDNVYEFVTPWSKMPHVWFLNHTDEKTLNNDYPNEKYKEINQQKIALMSPDAQRIMGFSITKKL